MCVYVCMLSGYLVTDSELNSSFLRFKELADKKVV